MISQLSEILSDSELFDLHAASPQYSDIFESDLRIIGHKLHLLYQYYDIFLR
ncbi:hypothetical protein D3C73_1572420 [compost metagenome]